MKKLSLLFVSLFLGITMVIVGEDTLLTPINVTNPVGTSHIMTATVQNTLGDPIVGRTVNFAIITATKTDDITVDNDNDGFADPGDVIEYTVTIQNSGDMNATGTNYDDAIDANTTLVPGSIRTTPIARIDGYSSTVNVGITVPAASGVLVNDNDPDGTTPTLTIFSFDATSINGGTVSVAGDGSFTYDPAPGFTGTDMFDYTIQDSDGNTDPAHVFITVNN